MILRYMIKNDGSRCGFDTHVGPFYTARLLTNLRFKSDHKDNRRAPHLTYLGQARETLAHPGQAKLPVLWPNTAGKPARWLVRSVPGTVDHPGHV